MLKKIIILSLVLSQANISASELSETEKYTTPEFAAFLKTTEFGKNDSKDFKQWVYDNYPRGHYCSLTIISRLRIEYTDKTGKLHFNMAENSSRK